MFCIPGDSQRPQIAIENTAGLALNSSTSIGRHCDRSGSDAFYMQPLAPPRWHRDGDIAARRVDAQHGDPRFDGVVPDNGFKIEIVGSTASTHSGDYWRRAVAVVASNAPKIFFAAVCKRQDEISLVVNPSALLVNAKSGLTLNSTRAGFAPGAAGSVIAFLACISPQPPVTLGASLALLTLRAPGAYLALLAPLALVPSFAPWATVALILCQ